MIKKMPDTDRIAASKAAVKARQERAMLKKKLRDGELSHLTVLKQALAGAQPHAGLRVTDFILTLPGIGIAKMPQVLEQIAISERKRLGALGANQRVLLEEYLREKLRVPRVEGSPLTVLAGPTAVGKGTVANYIREHHPDIQLSVSATTRKPRPGEIDGVHYYFVTEEEFDRMLAEGEFLEWAKVHNSYRYGTPKTQVSEAKDRGMLMLLEIDLQGARQVAVAMPDARMVFLAPPSWEELTRRLIGRGTESAEEQQRRLRTAKVELAAQPEFDYTIVNDTVERAAEKLVQIMREI